MSVISATRSIEHHCNKIERPKELKSSIFRQDLGLSLALPAERKIEWSALVAVRKPSVRWCPVHSRITDRNCFSTLELCTRGSTGFGVAFGGVVYSWN